MIDLGCYCYTFQTLFWQWLNRILSSLLKNVCLVSVFSLIIQVLSTGVHTISTFNQLMINNRSKWTENKFWEQIHAVKMTDGILSDCSNSGCAMGLVMIIFHSPLQIFWPSFAFCGVKKKKKKKGSELFTAGSTVWQSSWYVTARANVVSSTPWEVHVCDEQNPK